MKKTLAIALALALMLSFVSCSTAGTSEKQQLKVGMECNYTPFNWTQMDDSNNAVSISTGGYAGGYDVEIAKLLAEALDRELVIVKTEWDGLIPALNSGKIDVVIAGMSPTAKRAESVDFSDPYYESELVLVVNKDGAYASATSLADFSGAKITAQLNTFHYTVIDQIPGVAKQTAMETFPAMIVALNSGKIDGYVSERPGAVSAMAANSGISYVEFEEGKGFEASKEDVAISVAVKKGSEEFVQSINDALAAISQETREEMMNAAVENQPINEE